MADGVVGVAFERDIRELPVHPAIERIVKKKIRQHGTDNRALRAASFPVHQGSVRHAHRCLEPPLEIQKHPCAVGVSAHRPHQKSPIDFVEETFDVEVQHPVTAPASLARHGQGIMR